MTARSLLLCLLLAAGAASAAPRTEIQYLSGVDKDHRVNWQFHLDGGRNSGAWRSIPVPSNWELEGFGTYRYYNDTKEPVADTTGIYRHGFEVPASWQGKRIEIVFGGAMTDTRVVVNGQEAGPVHRGGFYEFRYDVTRLLKPGARNDIEVTVKRFSSDESVNRAERTADFWLFSGIYRPVWLEAKPSVHIERVSVDARHDGAFTSEVFSGGERVTAQVLTLEGKPVGRAMTAAVVDGRARLTGRIAGVRAWSAEDPQRYQVRYQAFAGGRVLHEVSKTIGFRTVELRPQDGLYVNGAKVRLKGSNRHSIWPTSGRTTSRALSYTDARLMKEMNMNAVRMSHYPPDEHFLEVCDELGLYVIDELTGWQKAYDTAAGTPLVGELVRRDQHHPSVILWANGNEGGFNLELDALYGQWDLQKRPVIHPWANYGGIDAAHYLNVDCCANSFFHGRDVFMPTEFLHGLYDGGAGAGLSDWWNAMLAHPLSAGGFIWAFADEGVVRTDKNGEIDVAGNQAPDGIVGPYREKEGSFFAIKEIWSPVYLPLAELSFLPASFDGHAVLENRYDHTDLNRVRLHWKLVRTTRAPGVTVAAQGSLTAPHAAPGMRAQAHLALPANWREHDALLLTATDRFGKEIYTWSWMIARADALARRMALPAPPGGAVALKESAEAFELSAGALQVSIRKADGYLGELKKGGVLVPLTNGPRTVSGSASLTSIRAVREGADVLVQAEYQGDLKKLTWRLTPAGMLSVRYALGHANGKEVDALGVTFDYPEAGVRSMRWLGKGPYRVWKNRTQGVEFGVWEKQYNDTVTGLSWDYPEFKGFHDQVLWATFATSTLPLTFVNHADDIALRVFTPREASAKGSEPKSTHVDFPPGDISFLNTILPIGTKFRPAADHGASGQRARTPNLGFYAENTIDILVGEAVDR